MTQKYGYSQDSAGKLEAVKDSLIYNTFTYVDKSKEQVEENIREYIFNNPETVEKLIKDGKANKEAVQLEARQAWNKIQRNKVQHVKFSGDTCIIYWNDGTITKSRWDWDEPWDGEKAILAAMARKLYGDTSIYCEVLQKYAPDARKHYEEYIYPNFVAEDARMWWAVIE